MIGSFLMQVNESLAAYSGLISVGLLLMNLLLAAAMVQMRMHAVKKQAELAKQSNMSNVGVIGVGQRVLSLEKRLSELGKLQQELSDSQNDAAYTRARALLLQGRSESAVAASTGISAAEVELIKMIHAQAKHPGQNSIAKAG